MKKKNLVLMGSAAMLSLALAGSLGAVVTASAATISDSSSGPQDIPVTYNVADTWTVTIPDSIEIDGERWEGTGTVSASDVLIEKNTTLTVTVGSQNEWKLNDPIHSGNYIEYKLDAGDADFTNKDGNTVLTVNAGTASGEATLTATVEGDEQKYSTGGEEYKDQLTFTVTVSDPAGE